MGLSVTARELASSPMFELAGELDIYTARGFIGEIEKVSPTEPCLVLDLSAVSLVDSSGLGALLRLAQSGGGNRPVVLICNGPTIPRLLELTRLSDRFILTDSRDEAERAVAAQATTPTPD